MNTSLVISLHEDKLKKRLQQSIFRKRKVLEESMEKVETLKVELELIKNEYTVRIGYLFLKDNQLDLEIIQYKNLKKLIDEGMTYEEAVKAEEDKFYNEILRMQKEQERIEEEKSFFEKRQEIPEDIKDRIRQLWKRLIRRFHPDLVSDPKEKSEREVLMKKVNKAYTQGDLISLQELENNEEVNHIEETDLEKLKLVLIQTENLIRDTKQEFRDLRESEWYMWKEKIEKTKIDVFAEIERKLLDDIVKKIAILRELREEVK